MAQVLTPEQIARYRGEGYLGPLEALGADEVAAQQAAFHRFLSVRGWPLAAAAGHKPHLLQKSLSDLVHHPTIVGAVTDILGPDVFAWRSNFFIKEPRDAGYVSWHQDSVYWALEPHDIATAWVALTDSNPENGCMRVAPGSHSAPELAHGHSPSRRNRLLRGQVADVEVPPEQVRMVVLRAGQFSLHHVRLLHSSPPNPTDAWRVGFVIRYVACHVRRRGLPDAATLVAGADRYGHFEHEPIPTCDDDQAVLEWHRRSVRRYAKDVVRETLMRPSLATLATLARIALNPRIYRGLITYLSGRRLKDYESGRGRTRPK